MTEPKRAVPDPTADLSRHQLATDQAHAYLHRGGSEYTPEVMRWMVEGLLLMGPDDLHILATWLTGRERDIAGGREDLGLLASVFKAVMGREPRA